MDISELSIVVVEPSHAQWLIISGKLNEQGVTECHWFNQGQDAFDASQRIRPDLVMSAMYLPDMTGVDLVHKIRGDSRLDETMFMLISTETDPNQLEPVRQAGVVGILPKPFDPRDLRRALYAAVDYVDNAQEEDEDADSLVDLKVLLVDDSSISRSMMRRIFHKLGMENIVEVADGSEAIEKLRDDYFDLVVTDYNMPEVDGYELVKYVRASARLSATPVLMVTAESDAQRLAAVHQEGVSAICDKPFEPSSFSGLIKGLLAV